MFGLKVTYLEIYVNESEATKKVFIKTPSPTQLR